MVYITEASRGELQAWLYPGTQTTITLLQERGLSLSLDFIFLSWLHSQAGPFHVVTKWPPMALALATPVEKELEESFRWLGLGPLPRPVPVSARMGR